MVEGGNHCCQGLANVSKLRRLLGTVDLEELPDSRERAGAPVLWLSCEGRIDVWELFSDNSNLSAILDRHGLLEAVKVSRHNRYSASGPNSRKRIPRTL